MANLHQFASQAIFVPDLTTKEIRSSHQVRCTPWPRHVTQSAPFRVDTDIPDASSLQISQPLPVTSSRPLNHFHLIPEVDPDVLKQADAVRKESLQCSALVARMGRGAVYLGSSRIGEGHSFFQRAQDLSRKVALLLDCTTWSGIGPGLMEAVTRGAIEAQKPAAGLKILLEAGGVAGPEWKHPHLPQDAYITCCSIAARKKGLLDAGTRHRNEDFTTFIALPGGVGTLDEVFDILALMQLGKCDFNLKVPYILVNYDGCFDKLIGYFEDMEDSKIVSKGEIQQLLHVCNDNYGVIEYLAKFYNIQHSCHFRE